MKKIALVMLLLALATQTAACVSVEVDSDGNTKTAYAQESSVAGVGDTIEDGTWRITLSSAKVYDKVGTDFLITEPDEGKQFLIVFMEVENISSEDDYFNYLNIESYVDGYNQSFDVLLSDVDGYETLTGDVAAGKKLKGYLAFQVTPEWTELEYSYRGNMFSKDKLTFVVKPEDITK